MDFSFSEEQVMLADAVRRFAEKEYGHLVAGTAPPDREQRRANWRKLGGLGLLGLLVPSEYGGLERDMTDVLAVMHEFGRGRVLEPYVGSALASACILVNAADTYQKERWLPSLVDGSTVFVLAVDDADDTPTPTGVELRQGKLYGRKTAVLSGDLADKLIVPAYCATLNTQRVYCVDAFSVGLLSETYPTIDGQTVADIRFNGVLVQDSDELKNASDIAQCIDLALDVGRAALCAEAWGALEAVFQQTLEHLKTRKQFGAPLATFQSLRHRSVEMMIAVEQAQSVALMATAGVLSSYALIRRQNVSAAKAQIGRYIRRVAEQAIQSVGGMGMTQEFSFTGHIQRLQAISMTWGTTDYHVDRYSETLI